MWKIKDRFDSLFKFLRSSRKTILLMTITVVVTLVISSIISVWLSKISNLKIPSVGNIRTQGLEAYWDQDLANKTETLDWGMIRSGASKNVSVYLQSTSNFETTFNLTTGNWTFWNSDNEIAAGPSNSTLHMYLTWDYDNSAVHPGEVRKVTLTLYARLSSEFIEFLIVSDVKAFSFDIHICTSEYS